MSNALKRIFLAGSVVFAQHAWAETDLQIKLNAIKTGDNKQTVLAILGPPAIEEANTMVGVSCQQLTYTTALTREKVTITLCFNRVLATKYEIRPVFPL